MERRTSLRAKLGQSIWLNKFVEGCPHLAELVEVSDSGLLLRTIHEPLNHEGTFTLELTIPGSTHRMWLWAEKIRDVGELQAVRVVHADLLERAALRQLARWHSAAA